MVPTMWETYWQKKAHVCVVAPPPAPLTLSAGYLGYTSGLSLLCMVFFLIVVSVFTCFLVMLYAFPACLVEFKTLIRHEGKCLQRQ